MSMELIRSERIRIGQADVMANRTSPVYSREKISTNTDTHPAPSIVEAAQKDATQNQEQQRKEHLQKIFQVGEYSMYTKEPRPMKFEAFRHASYEFLTSPGAFFKNFGKHVSAIDTEFRGHDIGGAKERLERSGELAKIVTLFTIFDYATSKPFELLFPLKKGEHLSADDVRVNARNRAFKKLVEVMNDKYATALGNLYVEKLTGKRGFIHEVADKGADTIQTGFPKSEDWINGATLESYIRLASQVPIAGAIVEQIATRLAGWQEKSALHTATGKMTYMGLGVLIRESRVAGKMEADEITEAVARTLI